MKTIYHENTTGKNSRDTQWTHPDIVGVSFPFTGKGNSYESGILDLMSNVAHSEIVFYSFEMKISISTVNDLRNNFFQALSNSNWANEGYLVAAYYNNYDTLYDEMRELNNTYGIGFIMLDIEDYRDSRIILHAKQKKDIDWNRIDKLYQNNCGFAEFIDSVTTNLKNNSMLKNKEYDELFDDEDDDGEKGYNQYKEKLIEMGIYKHKK